MDPNFEDWKDVQIPPLFGEDISDQLGYLKFWQVPEEDSAENTDVLPSPDELKQQFQRNGERRCRNQKEGKDQHKQSKKSDFRWSWKI